MNHSRVDLLLNADDSIPRQEDHCVYGSLMYWAREMEDNEGRLPKIYDHVVRHTVQGTDYKVWLDIYWQ